FIGDRPVNAAIHPAGLPINTSEDEVLRRPIESAPGAVVRVKHHPAHVAAPGVDGGLDGAGFNHES
ncbi:hypothetical protein, partial [Kitasatospora sp. NPDC092286]|uniref:hypothetical protein n=1 Tax=Kitasatospora sp. NPDC092286 TaxID=3364087 RepID=UPI003803F7CF